MGSTDSLDSGKDSTVDDQSPQHDEYVDRRRKVGGDKTAIVQVQVTSPTPTHRYHNNHHQHHNHGSSSRSKSADGEAERKTHAKSLSVGDDSFDQKIQLWRKRADSQGSMDRKSIAALQTTRQSPPPPPLPEKSAAVVAGVERRIGGIVGVGAGGVPMSTAVAEAQKSAGGGGAPDLVMDLPADGCGGVQAVPVQSEPDSPDMGTAAERFAKQNQCTLKKYSKPAGQPLGKPELPPKSSKPPIKAKPQIFKKPVFLHKSTDEAPQP